MMKSPKGICAKIKNQNGLIPNTKRLPLPKKVVLPLSTSWGDTSPIVKTGDKVTKGQCIAEHKDKIYPPVFASISGTVTEIKPWPVFSGKDALSIVIESDGDDSSIRQTNLINTVTSTSGSSGNEAADILKAIAGAGIKEVDSYQWPLSVRIGQPSITPQILFPLALDLRRPVEFLIINGMDRQPGLTLRRSALVSNEQQFLESISVLRKVSGAQNTVLTVYKKQIVSAEFEQKLKDLDVTLVKCPNKYPAALEPFLVQMITGRQIPQPNGDARIAGAVVIDVITALRVLDAVKKGIPATDTVVQVTSHSQGLDVHVQVPQGITLEELLNNLPSFDPKVSKIIVGGLFLGYAQYDLSIPITSETDSINLLSKDEVSSYENNTCVSCGYCVRHCPMNLLPNELGRLCEYNLFEIAEKKDIYYCIECGICSYVCPVKRPMVHLIRFGKQELSAMKGVS